MLSRPGALAQPWHRDSGQLFKGPTNTPAHAVTIFAPLVEVSSEMGRTSFVPESHLTDDINCNEVGTSHVTPVLPYGSWLAFDNRIVHRGEANSAVDMDRPILYFVYGKNWFQDVNNFPSDKPLYPTPETESPR